MSTVESGEAVASVPTVNSDLPINAEPEYFSAWGIGAGARIVHGGPGLEPCGHSIVNGIPHALVVPHLHVAFCDELIAFRVRLRGILRMVTSRIVLSHYARTISLRQLIDWFLESRDPNRADMAVAAIALTLCCLPMAVIAVWFHQWGTAAGLTVPYLYCCRELWRLTLEDY